MSSSEFIRVNARLRPSATFGNAKPALLVDTERNIVKCKDKKYTFDKTFGADSTQEIVFKEVGKRVIDGAIEGINGTIFAYGQTGSGKTHTMLGPADDDNIFLDFEKKGLIPRCIEYLFSRLEHVQTEKGSKFCFSVSCSFVELYNENLSDLLTANCPPIAIRAESRKIILQGALYETVASYIDAMRLIQIGWDNRTVGETKMNKESSRSHAVLIIDVTMMDDDGGVINKRESRINLVDLAGSERQSHTQSTGIRLKEAGKINQSLCTLGRVIRDLSAKKSHIPYRDSKLTLMIRDSLGGNSRTAVIVCAHPDEDFFAESLSTLQFAEQCRLVKNELHINREVTGESVVALRIRIQQLEDLLENSKRELTSKFEEKIRVVEEERDSYKQLLTAAQREKERADLEETMAACESPPQQYKTPATKKSRRRTRFTLSTQKTVREFNQIFEQPLVWGDEVYNAGEKENISQESLQLPIDQIEDFKKLVREKQEEITTLQDQINEKDSKLADAQSKMVILEQKTQQMQQETDQYCRNLTALKYQIDDINRERDQVEQNLCHSENERLALESKVENLKGALVNLTEENKKIAAGTDAAVKKHIERLEKNSHKEMVAKNNKIIELEKSINQYKNICSKVITEKEKALSSFTQKQNEYNELVQKQEEQDRYIKRVENDNAELIKAVKESRCIRKTLEQEKEARAKTETQLFEAYEKSCGLETRLSIIEGTLADKEEEIKSLKQEIDDLQKEVAELAGHTNRQQRIKMMEKYAKEAADLRLENCKLKAENSKLKKK